MITVKFKKLVEHAVEPSRREGDVGFDLVAIDMCENHDFNYVEFGTGVALELPRGYCGLLFPRSSISKTSHTLCNSIGLVDQNYIGELKLRFRVDKEHEHLSYAVGDRVAQLVIIPYPDVKLEETETLTETIRNQGAFGSTGR